MNTIPIKWVEVECQYRSLDPCWECVSHKTDSFGYPRHGKNGVNTKMCKTFFIEAKGAIPQGLVIRHKCDNPKCINPNHLELGTRKDNAIDRTTRGRSKSKLTQEQVLSIRQDKRLLRELSAIYGVSESVISNIRNKKTWGWLS